MKAMEARKSPLWWWNSHIGPRNSKWLSENVEEIDRLVSETLKLIEADGDSFAKKAQMYYLSRPELISRVENFYRLYRALAERYDQATIELAKYMSTEPQCHDSCNGSEIGTEAISASLPSSPDRTPEVKAFHFGPRLKAAGFNFFLGSEEISDRSRKRSDESSSESGSESDYYKHVYGYDNASFLEARVIELQNELRKARDKLQENRNGLKEQCELLLNRVDLVLSPANSTIESQAAFEMNFVALERMITELEVELPDHKGEFEHFQEEVKAAAEHFEIEISRREDIIKEYKTTFGEILNKIVQDDSSLVAETKADDAEILEGKSTMETKSKEEVQTMRDMKACVRQSSNRLLLRERSVLEAQLCSLMVSNNSYESKIQALEVRVKQLEAEKSNICTESEERLTEINQNLEDYKVKVVTLTSEKEQLDARVGKLEDDVKAQDEHTRTVEEHLHELQEEHKKQAQEIQNAQKALVDQTNRVKELEDEVEGQRLLIIDGAEGKREAIRQLCFSLEHYRVGYQELRQMLQHKRSTVMAI
ncbi:hypothetical protein HPP92_001666 [Vanilla planifolia]|uniref:NAB domain-containing protein n=1 Tax=Vanilla planifolia TaxID=51239 RepID=A0A835VH97_VANPL|nr:hypothetical protein HPP92_001666 [Vanilla planifolia]